MFELYKDKSSLDKRRSRFVQGGMTDINGNKLGWWERDNNFLKSDVSDSTFIITKEFEFLPDNIAGYVYDGRTDLEWVILQYNKIIDIFEELKAGKVLVIPTIQRALSIPQKVRR